MIFTFLRTSAICAAMAFASWSGFAIAQTNVSQQLISETRSDAAERINLSSKLAMLAIQGSVSSCAANSSATPDHHKSLLANTKYEFERILGALQNGDEELNILSPEDNPKISGRIEAIRTNWAPLSVAHSTVTGEDYERLHYLDHLIDNFSKRTLLLGGILTGNINSIYSNPFEMTYADTMLINIAANQRILSQRLMLEACYIWSGFHPEAAREELEGNMGFFENAVMALRDGMPELSIEPAPTQEILSVIDQVLSHWDNMRPAYSALVEGKDLTQDERSILLQEFEASAEQLNLLVASYVKYATR
ncbi:MAG: type IV pili methyl-accepting chemotaxis transducer N-terminal domain-containing protein [Pseudomonadota bacterium]